MVIRESDSDTLEFPIPILGVDFGSVEHHSCGNERVGWEIYTTISSVWGKKNHFIP